MFCYRKNNKMNVYIKTEKPATEKMAAETNKDKHRRMPALSFWQIWNMCFGFLGIQFGFALQNANVSRIFQTLGAEVDKIALLWIAAPLTGLIVQPIIGHFSDRTWTRFGRRRPYFMAGALLTTLALVFMPNSPTLWIAAGILWILDASINIAMEPFRAFVGDKLPNEQRAQGFAMQSFFIGIGAVVASLFPWFLSDVVGVSNVAEAGAIPDSVRYAFYAGAVVLLVSMAVTILSTSEYSPEELATFENPDGANVAPSQRGLSGENISKTTRNNQTAFLLLQTGVFWMAGALLLLVAIKLLALDKQLFILAGAFFIYGLIKCVADMRPSSNTTPQNFVFSIVENMNDMPLIMKRLAWVQFFSWFALFAMWIYTTAAVTDHHFGALDTSTKAYNEGADWVGVLFAVYNGVAALVALGLPRLCRLLSPAWAHALCLSCGAIGLFSIFWVRDPDSLIFSMVGIGIAWASILALPYALLSSQLPHDKMGVFMGIFNFFIVIPQLLAASILGLMVKYFFAGEAIYALMMGGVSFMIAAMISVSIKK